MSKRFGKNFENIDSKIEREEVSYTMAESSLDKPYSDEFDKKLDEFENKTKQSKRKEFLQEIKVEQPQIDTPLTLAYKELERARQSGIKEDIIKSEDTIFDIERDNEEKEYQTQISELENMLHSAKRDNNADELERLSKVRKKLDFEMRYDKINYSIKKLQNSQRLAPSKEKLQQIMQLKQELEALEIESLDR